MTQVWRKDSFGSDVVSDAEKLDINFQIGVFVDFPTDNLTIQATCMVGGDLIRVFSSADVIQLMRWVKDAILEEIEKNQEAIDNASSI